jgi:hypothetical protein
VVEYIVNCRNMSNGFTKNIDKKQFDESKKSKEILSERFSKENIYNLILMNYYEFEKELYTITLDNKIFQSDYREFNNYKLKIEQRILNLLSSITLYLDSFKEDLDTKISVYLKDEMKLIDEYSNSELKNNPKNKIMKYIRNHIQHNGLLIDKWFLEGKKITEDLNEEIIGFYIDKNSIKARFYLSKSNYFNEIDEDINLKNYIREYVDFISRVHNLFRETINEKVKISREYIESIFLIHKEYKFLFLSKIEKNNLIEEIPLFLDWDNIRIELESKNKVPTYFRRHSINTK